MNTEYKWYLAGSDQKNPSYYIMSDLDYELVRHSIDIHGITEIKIMGCFNGLQVNELISLRDSIKINNIEPIFPQSNWESLLENINKGS